MSLVTSGVSAAVLFGLDISAEQTAVITLVINNLTLLVALFLPAGGTPSVSQGEPKLSQ